MNLTVETEREEDGRWIAEVPDLAGVLAYGKTRDEAIARAEALALRCSPIGWSTPRQSDVRVFDAGTRRHAHHLAHDSLL